MNASVSDMQAVSTSARTVRTRTAQDTACMGQWGGHVLVYWSLEVLGLNWKAVGCRLEGYGIILVKCEYIL